MPGQRDDRVHVDRVEVGPLLAVDLDADEVLVHQRRRRGVLERLVLHHVAPVAGGVADREQDRPVLAPRPRERLLAPRIPVDRVLGVLEQVRARLGGEPVHARTSLTPRNLVSISARVRDESSRQSSGRESGAGRPLDRPPDDELGELGPRDAVGAGDVQRSRQVERRQLEERGCEIADLDRQRISFVKNVVDGSRAASSCFDRCAPP